MGGVTGTLRFKPSTLPYESSRGRRSPQSWVEGGLGRGVPRYEARRWDNQNVPVQRCLLRTLKGRDGH